jgi:hypothetical protein
MHHDGAPLTRRPLPSSKELSAMTTMTTRILLTALCMTLASACVQESWSVDTDQQLLMTVDEPVVETPDGYRIAMPAKAAATLPTDRRVELTVAMPDGSSSSVLGRIERSSTGVVTLVTGESLQVPLAVPGSQATLSEPDPIFGCLPAEFGIDCFASSYITMCAGTTYCLPGNGPGGFTCQCL